MRPLNGGRSGVIAACLLAVDLLVFLRWQRGLYNHVDGGATLFLVTSLLWSALAAVTVGVVTVRTWHRGHFTRVMLVAAIALVSQSVVPANLTGVAMLHAYLTLALFGGASPRFARVAFIVATLVLSFLASYQRQYGLLSRDAIEAALQTHVSEAVAYVVQHLTIAHGAAVGAWLVTAFAWRTWGVVHVRRVPAAAVLTLLAVPVLFSAADTVSRQALDARQALKAVARQSDGAQMPEGVVVEPATGPSIDVVLLIGESSTRWNWSLYGYPRETTPRLEALRDDLIIFDDVVSVHSHTVPAMREMAFRQTEGREALREVADVSLIAVLRKAGVAVSWHSAQTRYGPYSNTVSGLAEASGDAHFHESPNRWVRKRLDVSEHPDWRVTRSIEQALGTRTVHGPSRLLVGHFHVSHFPYCANLPRGDDAAVPGMRLGPAYFGDSADLSADVECYDRSIRMTDAMVADVVETARQSQRPTIVIFVPDHGEAPDEGSGHQSDLHSSRHIEVPLVLAFNAAARQQFPEKYAALRTHASAPMSNGWMFELVAELFDLQIKGLSLKGASIGSPAFRPEPRVAFEGPTPVLYDQRSSTDRKDVIGRTRVNLQAARGLDRRPKTIYAHRVDSLGKLLEAKRYFGGLEVDLITADEGRDLAVRHPPKPDTGLRLGEWLRAADDHRELQLWADLKSPLDDAAVVVLQRLDAQYRLRDRMVIEFTADASADAAQRLAQEGWSLAMPASVLIPHCLTLPQGPDCERQAAAAEPRIRAVGARALSFELRDARLVRAHLSVLVSKLRLMAWDQGLRSDDHDFVERLARVPRVDDLIVRYRSRFDY